MHLMSRHANHEYKQNKENYVRYFTMDSLFYTLYIIILLLRKKDGLYTEGSSVFNENNPGVQIMLVFYILNGYQLLISYCILYLKLN